MDKQLKSIEVSADQHVHAQTFNARWSEDRRAAQALTQHLRRVSGRCRQSALVGRPQDLGFQSSATLAGLIHDLGKYRLQFQIYLNAHDRGQRSVETAHSVYGAAAAIEKWDSLAVAFAIAGHHSGLHDEDDLSSLIGGSKFRALTRYPCLLELASHSPDFANNISLILPNESDGTKLPPTIAIDDGNPDDIRRFDVFVRMLFSILVDADRLDSEKFEQEHRFQRAWERPVRTLDADALLVCLESERMKKGVEKWHCNRELNQLRNSVFDASRRCARTLQQGFFSLTVPTGGGKTLSSMAFALEHALANDLRRVIVVIPYLSIIEQNAGIYRTIFGPDQVLEHHSAVEVKQMKSSSSGDEPPHVLDAERAMENWDVPIVVTTSVQFIESLFAAATGRARKLHNIARSVVIFDEVQTLPPHLLEPTLDVLRTLQKHFGVSFLFCSATQPAFRKSGNLTQGFRDDEIIEIAPNVNELFQKLCRVSYDVRPPVERWDWMRVASEMLHRPQTLCVVNLRQHAFEIFAELNEQPQADTRGDAEETSVFHLSSAMCSAHRLDLLGLSNKPPRNNIKARLEANRPCWVVSTQLIEAGVDIDFPTVFRAMGPLDSIVQAAGRCNREGRLRDESGQPMLGEVIVFHPQDSGLPRGVYEKATSITPPFLSNPNRLTADPALFAEYFNELYQITPTDRVRRGEHTIQQLREELKFRTVAERAKVIADNTVTVCVPYRRAAKIIAKIRKAQRVDFRILRRLQRYMVNLRPGPNTLYEQLVEAGRLESLHPDLDLLVLDAECYDPQCGVVFKQRAPEDLIV
ncbi:MAG: CRISPR-associated helicase Cas3' [Candidatus Paceibacterota bacterium]